MKHREEAVEAGLAVEVKPNFLLFNSISPERLVLRLLKSINLDKRLLEEQLKSTQVTKNNYLCNHE